MKKSLILSMLFLLLIMAGCKSTAKNEITLPPKPTRSVMPEINSLKDLANVINYYEHLVEQWEEWGDTVTLMIGAERQ